MTFKMIKKSKEEGIAECEVSAKKKDMLTKAKNKLFNISESLKSNKNLNVPGQTKKSIIKSKTHVNLDHLLKESSGKNQIYINTKSSAVFDKPSPLKKQISVDSYPIRIEITDENDETTSVKSRSLSSGVCANKFDAGLGTEALALEKPRKKLSFRVPEILGTFTENRLGFSNVKNNRSGSFRNIRDIIEKAGAKPSFASFNGVKEAAESFDDSDLESQAMRVVRTIGQAFEVCHKLSLNNPDNEQDHDEQDTLTQDLLSDRLSDITSDKPKRDIMSEGASDRMSLPPDDCSFKDLENCKNVRTSAQLDILPPPPNTNIRSNMLSTAEMYSSPHSDGITTGSAESGGSLPPAGSALSTHHEIQLLREQLEQQTQQTQAALAQLQLAREQLAAEQSARLEAQARTHQLLIHNRELLDHIAALVAHLQGNEKSGQQPAPPHMTMPQQATNQVQNDNADVYEYADTPMAGFNILGSPDNRPTSFVPSSPIRNSFNPGGNILNFAYPQPLETTPFENQLLQKLQALNSFPSAYPFQYPYSQSIPFLLQNLYTPPINNAYTLQNSSQRNTLPIFLGKPQTGGRHSEPKTLNTSCFHRNQSPPSKKEEYQSQHNYHTQTNNETYQQKESDSPIYQKIIPKKEENDDNNKVRYQRESSPNPIYQTIIPKKDATNGKHITIQQKELLRRESSPRPQDNYHSDKTSGQFIKPHSQVGTLTTTDAGGRLRVLVPVLSNSRDDLSDCFGKTDEKYKNTLSRTCSDRHNKNSSHHGSTLMRHKSK